MPAGAGEAGYVSGISYGGLANSDSANAGMQITGSGVGGHGYCRITDADGTVTTYSYTGTDITITVP